MHPDHFDPPLDDGVVHETSGAGIVCLDGGFGLFPPDFLQRVVEWYHFYHCGVECGKFSFSADAITNLMIWEIMRIGQLHHGIGSSLERKMCAPPWLCDPGSVRKRELQGSWSWHGR